MRTGHAKAAPYTQGLALRAVWVGGRKERHPHRPVFQIRRAPPLIPRIAQSGKVLSCLACMWWAGAERLSTPGSWQHRAPSPSRPAPQPPTALSCRFFSRQDKNRAMTNTQDKPHSAVEHPAEPKESFFIEPRNKQKTIFFLKNMKLAQLGNKPGFSL